MDSFEMIDPDAITLPYSGLRLNTLEEFEMDFGHVSATKYLFLMVTAFVYQLYPKGFVH